MPNDKQVLDVLQQALAGIQHASTRLAKTETGLAGVDQYHATLDRYL